MGCGSSRGDGAAVPAAYHSTEKRPDLRHQLVTPPPSSSAQVHDSSEIIPNHSVGETDALLQQYLL
jgi:hypothetical protein